MKKWIVKLKRYDGSESVMTRATPNREDAEAIARTLNEEYQSDSFHVEEWIDPKRRQYRDR